ncbi:MAG: SagB/ThcOx family dehydrogenase [Verrucomicrobia bacterium]|nr:SagB/ThcOx family dehydrogenase [Verrucomicrobiota bacterium]
MRTHPVKTILSLLTLTILLTGLNVSPAADSGPVPLPAPRMTGGKPLMQALKERKTLREFTTQKLPLQTLSDLLWAACGINRPENDHRTVPSAMNSQEIDLYVATADGVFLYEPKPHQLCRVLAGDIRDKTGKQPFVKVAPLALILVADYAKMVKPKPDQKDFYAAIDAGFIGQNIYLFCASEGLACVIHDLDRAALAAALPLRPEQKIIIAHTVGYPQK